MCQQDSYGVTHRYRCHLMFCPINIGKLRLRELSLPETKGMLANTDLLICHPEVFRSISWPPSHGSDLLCLPGRLCSWMFPSSPWVRSRDGAAPGGGEGAPGGSRTVQHRMHRGGTLLRVMRTALAQLSLCPGCWVSGRAAFPGLRSASLPWLGQGGGVNASYD